MVLLKNNAGLLPLKREYSTIAAVGIMDCMGAGYDSAQGVKVKTDAALAAAFPNATIKSGPGCRCPYTT
jgi:hypothetical protein